MEKSRNTKTKNKGKNEEIQSKRETRKEKR